MSPLLIALLLFAMFVALIPVRRLAAAGWSAGSLFTTWTFYSLGLFAGLRFPGLASFVLPVLVVAFVLPFVAGPERLARLLGRRQRLPVVIDVTPRPAPGLAAPPAPVDRSGAAAGPAAASDASQAPDGRPSQRWVPGRPGRTRRPPEEER